MSNRPKIKKFVTPRKYPPRGTPLDSVGMRSLDGTMHAQVRRFADGKGGCLPLSPSMMEMLGYGAGSGESPKKQQTP